MHFCTLVSRSLLLPSSKLALLSAHRQPLSSCSPLRWDSGPICLQISVAAQPHAAVLLQAEEPPDKLHPIFACVCLQASAAAEERAQAAEQKSLAAAEAAAAAEERAHAAELRAVELTAKAAEQEQRALQLTAQAVEQVQQAADGQISDLREMLQGERDEKAELQGQLEVRFRVHSRLLRVWKSRGL